MTPQRLLATALSDHPAKALTAVTHLRELLDQLEHQHALALRRNGATWTHIGHILGITKQSARERFIHWDPTQT